MPLDTARKIDIFETALSYVAAAAGSSTPAATPPGRAQATPPGARPLLYGPDGRAITPDAYFNFRKTAAKRTGSMKTWIPQRLFSHQYEAMEREQVVSRAVDLANNDPHAAGVVDTFAAMAIGAGLSPHPTVDREALGLSEEEVRQLQAAQLAAYRAWHPTADAAGRMDFGGIQYLCMRNLVEYGEYIMLLPMMEYTSRPYSLACQVVSPLRLKTPVDLVGLGTIHDGIELGDYGEPTAYWIKKSSRAANLAYLPDVAQNFIRVPARQGHRWNVLHCFVSREPEQLRGTSFFAPAMKLFRDLNDYLDAELVSNIVTAAFALFVKTGAAKDPFNVANTLASWTETTQGTTGSTQTTRYQEWEPGMIMYGNTGEEVTPISASRPGTTFDPFTRIIKKAIAMSINMPYPVIFSDVDGLSFAGWRGAMLDAWRSIMFYRDFCGDGSNRKIYTMLMEEAYLRGTLKARDFYTNMTALTRVRWRGAPKGDIEPIKAVQADILAVQNNLKTRAQAIAETTGEDVAAVFDQLAREQEMMMERGLHEGPVQKVIGENVADEGPVPGPAKPGAPKTGTSKPVPPKPSPAEEGDHNA